MRFMLDLNHLKKLNKTINKKEDCHKSVQLISAEAISVTPFIRNKSSVTCSSHTTFLFNS